jgi:hypothetical protein
MCTFDVVRIDPDATYTDDRVARIFEISKRQLRTWRKRRSGVRFPRPFFRGRRPCWKGRDLIAWEERLRAEVM